MHFGKEPNPSSHRQSAFQWSCFYGDRPIMDTMASLIFHNLFGRFERVRVISVDCTLASVALTSAARSGQADQPLRKTSAPISIRPHEIFAICV